MSPSLSSSTGGFSPVSSAHSPVASAHSPVASVRSPVARLGSGVPGRFGALWEQSDMIEGEHLDIVRRQPQAALTQSVAVSDAGSQRCPLCSKDFSVWSKHMRVTNARSHLRHTHQVLRTIPLDARADGTSPALCASSDHWLLVSSIGTRQLEKCGRSEIRWAWGM
jgi:hypothetical protein